MQTKLWHNTSIVFFVTVFLLLYLSSLYNYLLFHTIAEIFSICIAVTVFLIYWNSIPYIENNYLILVGIAYFFIGFLDLFHTMAYKGMQIFNDYDYYANQLWIVARYFESIVLYIAFASIKSSQKVNAYIFFGICSVITTIAMFSIFVWKIFPVCYVDGVGLTPFKIYSEYIICIILFAAIFVLHRNKAAFEPTIYRYLFVSMICTIISELAFTIYIDNYGFSNLVGHYFKILSFYLIYKTIIVKGIREPYEMIFRELKQKETTLFEQNSFLTALSSIDGLTGLFNHRYIYDCLEETAKEWHGKNFSFVVMILDIDCFKSVNDIYGHLTGDKVLKKLSQILKENTGASDLVGRYGGEEFLIMLVNVNLQEGFNTAEKIRKTVELSEFAQNVPITVSIGLEEYNGEKISELFEKADKKLYAAKRGGRNRTVM